MNTGLLMFEAFPERVALEGFDEEFLRGLGMLMALINIAPCFEVRMGRALVEGPVATVGCLVEEVRS